MDFRYLLVKIDIPSRRTTNSTSSPTDLTFLVTTDWDNVN